jgi:8-oxo-dGTP pyrophosphatase MutT (NUDIX family)
MHRRPLLELIELYERAHADEIDVVARVRALVQQRSDCFDRECLPGHITASAWILAPDRRRFLLTHHRKLGRWLQLGGHADGDPDVHAVALREAREESGMENFELLLAKHGCPAIDIDVHRIPARPGEPEHEHHDVRFLLLARAGQALRMSGESKDLRWVAWSEFDALAPDESLLRLGRKAQSVVSEL